MQLQRELLENQSKEQLIELMLKMQQQIDQLLNQQDMLLKQMQLQTPQQQLNRITIEELCDKHIRTAISREFSKGTIDKFKDAHTYFLEYAHKNGLIYADEITYDHAEEFYAFLKNHDNPAYGKRKDASEKLSRITCITYYKYIKAMFAIAEKRNHINKNPFVNIPLPQSPVKEWWDDDYVYNKLIPAVWSYNTNQPVKINKEKIELIIRLTYTTGIRAGILCRVKRKDITITDEGEIFIEADTKIPKSSKWQRHAHPVIHEETKKKLLAYLNRLDKKGIQPNDRIFTSERNNKPRAEYQNYRRTLIKVCKQAGIPYKTPHKAKHGCITKMAKAGMSSIKICKITGNRTPALVEKVYIHMDQKDAIDEANKTINAT